EAGQGRHAFRLAESTRLAADHPHPLAGIGVQFGILIDVLVELERRLVVPPEPVIPAHPAAADRLERHSRLEGRRRAHATDLAKTRLGIPMSDSSRRAA